MHNQHISLKLIPPSHEQLKVELMNKEVFVSSSKDDILEQVSQIFLNEEEIVSLTKDNGKIFEIKLNDEFRGHVLDKDLKEIIRLFPEFPSDILIKSESEVKWLTIFHHPSFQRRTEPEDNTLANSEDKTEINKKALAKEQSLTNIFLLINGMKDGPYTFEQIKNKILNKELAQTQTTSIDNGKTWIRLYELKIFDRRNPQSIHHLPELPQLTIFEHSKEETLLAPQTANLKDLETSAMAGLAYIGNISQLNHATNEFDNDENENEPFTPINAPTTDEETIQKSKFSKHFHVTLLLFSLIGLTGLYFTSPSDMTKEFLTNSSSNIKNIGQSPVKKKMEPKKTNKIRPVSKKTGIVKKSTSSKRTTKLKPVTRKKSYAKSLSRNAISRPKAYRKRKRRTPLRSTSSANTADEQVDDYEREEREAEKREALEQAKLEKEQYGDEEENNKEDDLVYKNDDVQDDGNMDEDDDQKQKKKNSNIKNRLKKIRKQNNGQNSEDSSDQQYDDIEYY